MISIFFLPVLHRPCLEKLLSVQDLINQSLIDGGEVLQNISDILIEIKPDVPGALSENITSIVAELERLFNVTLDLAKEVEEFGENLNETTACHLAANLEGLLLDLDAKNEELRNLTETVSQLPSGGSSTTPGEEIDTSITPTDSLVIIIMRVYMVCVSVQEEFVEIFIEITLIFSEIDELSTTSTMEPMSKSSNFIRYYG